MRDLDDGSRKTIVRKAGPAMRRIGISALVDACTDVPTIGLSSIVLATGETIKVMCPGGKCANSLGNGAPGGIRTPDPRLRRPSVFPSTTTNETATVRGLAHRQARTRHASNV
ncbi:MAG: hypothetical protein ACRD2A_03580, partial [Vicinamibacterales bacterium]